MTNRAAAPDLLTDLASEMWEERGEGAWPPADVLQVRAYLAFAQLTVDAIGDMTVGEVAAVLA